MVCGKGWVDLYDLHSLKIQKSVNYGMGAPANTFCSDTRYYVSFTNGSHISIGTDGSVRKTGLSMAPAVLYAQGRILAMNRGNFNGIIYELVNGELQPFIELKDTRFTQGVLNIDSTYWICTTDGVWRCDENGRPIDKGEPLFRGKNISGVCKDEEGNYWFSTLDKGILFVPDIDARITVMHNSVPQKIGIKNNRVFIAGNKNDIYSYNPSNSLMSLVYNDPIGHQVNSFLMDSVNKRFLVAAQMLKVFDNGFALKYANTKPVKEVQVVDPVYYAYAATGAAGLIKIRDDISSQWDDLFATYNENGSAESILLNEGRFRYVAYDASAGNLYFAGTSGLYKFSSGNTTGKKITLNGEDIYVAGLCVYNELLVVITTNNSMLLIGRNEQVTRVKTDKDVQLYKAYLIDKRLCILTSKGEKRFDDKENRIESSGMLRGVRCEEINDLRVLGDRILIATNKGVITLPNTQQEVESLPLFYITDISVNDRRIPPDSIISLDYAENNIEISYSAPAYRNPDKYPVVYKINNGEWLPASASARSLKLAALSPGNHIINFAQDLGSRRMSNATVIRLNIKHPYWLTVWFWSVVIIVIASSIYAYYKWQTGLLKKQNTLLAEKVVLERNLHTSVLMAIRSQMNPHFFYNALNTIQSFIITDDKRNATTYLSKFSKLTRTILEMTGKEMVTLQDEVNSLKLYLDLEKVRFNNEFTYSINVTRGLDTDVIKIPSMIVQPYIENSIKHGLLHMKGGKILLVDFLKKDDNLCIVIDDNGIGRKKSRELNKIRADKHKPFATEANMKRIEILNQGNNNIGVVYTDKVDAFGQSNGTIVTITIPLIK